MKVSGNHVLNAPPSEVWDKMMDKAILERTTPGIKELRDKGNNTYEAISEVRVGPVKGEFNGTLSIEDKIPKKSCTLVVDQKSKMGNVVAEIAMKFKETDEGNTNVDYTGNAKMSGVLATMGQRIMSGVVSTLSKQFFEAMESELGKDSSS